METTKHNEWNAKWPWREWGQQGAPSLALAMMQLSRIISDLRCLWCKVSPQLSTYWYRSYQRIHNNTISWQGPFLKSMVPPICSLNNLQQGTLWDQYRSAVNLVPGHIATVKNVLYFYQFTLFKNNPLTIHFLHLKIICQCWWFNHRPDRSMIQKKLRTADLQDSS